MIGHRYSWRGETWTVLCRGEPFDRGPRRNVAIVSDAGELVIRPFRGLRRADG